MHESMGLAVFRVRTGVCVFSRSSRILAGGEVSLLFDANTISLRLFFPHRGRGLPQFVFGKDSP